MLFRSLSQVDPLFSALLRLQFHLGRIEGFGLGYLCGCTFFSILAGQHRFSKKTGQVKTNGDFQVVSGLFAREDYQRDDAHSGFEILSGRPRKYFCSVFPFTGIHIHLGILSEPLLFVRGDVK